MSRGNVGILTSNYFNPEGNRIVYGGAERYSTELTRLLQEMDYQVEWWQIGNNWVREMLPGVKIHAVPETESPFLSFPSLNQTFHEQGVKLDYAIYMVTFLAYPQALEKSISISHGIYWDYPGFDPKLEKEEDRKEWLRRLYIALNNPRKIVSCDTNTINWANATFPNLRPRFEYIPNFVDREVYDVEVQPHGGIRVLFPRRMTTVRGINEALIAAEKITAVNREVEFYFVGRAHSDALERDLIHWTGERERIYYCWQPPHLMPEIYLNSDIIIIPSKAAEGTSLSCLEAMAAGKAIISSYYGGLSDLIIDGYNGLLIKPTCKNLEQAILKLIEDRDLRLLLGKRAKETAACFSLQKWRQQWSSLITEIFT